MNEDTSRTHTHKIIKQSQEFNEKAAVDIERPNGNDKM